MKNTICAFVIVMGAFSSTTAHSESRIVFQKDGYGCKLDYDRNVFSRGALGSDDFRQFSGPNNDTYFRVTAVVNDQNLTPREIRESFLLKKGTRKLVYDRAKTGFLVLSGYQGPNIFYSKISLSPDNSIICVLHVYYPREDKKVFDARVTRMSRSFTALK